MRTDLATTLQVVIATGRRPLPGFGSGDEFLTARAVRIFTTEGHLATFRVFRAFLLLPRHPVRLSMLQDNHAVLPHLSAIKIVRYSYIFRGTLPKWHGFRQEQRSATFAGRYGSRARAKSPGVVRGADRPTGTARQRRQGDRKRPILDGRRRSESGLRRESGGKRPSPRIRRMQSIANVGFASRKGSDMPGVKGVITSRRCPRCGEPQTTGTITPASPLCPKCTALSKRRSARAILAAGKGRKL